MNRMICSICSSEHASKDMVKIYEDWPGGLDVFFCVNCWLAHGGAEIEKIDFHIGASFLFESNCQVCNNQYVPDRINSKTDDGIVWSTVFQWKKKVRINFNNRNHWFCVKCFEKLLGPLRNFAPGGCTPINPNKPTTI